MLHYVVFFILCIISPHLIWHFCTSLSKFSRRRVLEREKASEGKVSRSAFLFFPDKASYIPIVSVALQIYSISVLLSVLLPVISNQAVVGERIKDRWDENNAPSGMNDG